MAAGRLHGAADRAEHASAVLDRHGRPALHGVQRRAAGQKLGENLTAANPKSLTLNLQAGVAYYSGVWAASGVGSYTYVLVQGTAPTTVTRPPSSGRPNVVVINLDDMRADMTAALPKLRQWLVDGGTSFRNGYVSTPSCCPSRASLMSGRYVHNNGQFQRQNLGFNLNLTVQRYLHDAGYLTGHAGKFPHWLDLSVEAPHFDRWTYFRGGYENVYMNFDGTVRRSQGYSTTIVFDRAIEYVDDRLVTHVDVLPTILAATGVTQVHATLDSRDLLSGHTRQTSWSTSWPTASQRTTPTPRPWPWPCERPDSAPGPAARSLAERRSSSRRRPARATADMVRSTPWLLEALRAARDAEVEQA